VSSSRCRPASAATSPGAPASARPGGDPAPRGQSRARRRERGRTSPPATAGHGRRRRRPRPCRVPAGSRWNGRRGPASTDVAGDHERALARHARGLSSRPRAHVGHPLPARAPTSSVTHCDAGSCTYPSARRCTTAGRFMASSASSAGVPAEASGRRARPSPGSSSGWRRRARPVNEALAHDRRSTALTRPRPLLGATSTVSDTAAWGAEPRKTSCTHRDGGRCEPRAEAVERAVTGLVRDPVARPSHAGGAVDELRDEGPIAIARPLRPRSEGTRGWRTRPPPRSARVPRARGRGPLSCRAVRPPPSARRATQSAPAGAACPRAAPRAARSGPSRSARRRRLRDLVGAGAKHLQPPAPVRRPRVADAHDPLHLLGGRDQSRCRSSGSILPRTWALPSEAPGPAAGGPGGRPTSPSESPR